MSDTLHTSVIITNYNYGRFLQDAIDSSLCQTHPYTEVIVVDDGSTDNSQDIIRSYGDRVLPILKKNGGQASAINTGFKASRGDVIVFLDSDDILLPNAVVEVIKYFDDPNVARVQWPLSMIDQSGKKLNQKFFDYLDCKDDLWEAVLHDGPACHVCPTTSGSAWSRGFLKRILPMPEVKFKSGADYYLSAWAPVLGSVRKGTVSQSLYRRHGKNDSVSRSPDQNILFLCQLWEAVFEGLVKYFGTIGVNVDLETWRANSYVHKMSRAAQEIAALIPSDKAFVLIDENMFWPGQVVGGRQCMPFLERNGQYWGRPADDETAVSELERLRRSGVAFVVFVWLAFWWLDYYTQFYRYLCTEFRCVLENDRLIVFDLRPVVT